MIPTHVIYPIGPDPLGEPIYRYRRGNLWWHGVYWTEDHTFAMKTCGNDLLIKELTRWPDADAMLRSGELEIIAEDGSVIGSVPDDAQPVEWQQLSLV